MTSRRATAYRNVPIVTYRETPTRQLTVSLERDEYEVFDQYAKEANVAKGAFGRLFIQAAMKRPEVCKQILDDIRKDLAPVQ